MALKQKATALAVNDPVKILTGMAERGKISSRGWKPPADLSPLEWAGFGPGLATVASSIQWVIADWILAGQQWEGFAGIVVTKGELEGRLVTDAELDGGRAKQDVKTMLWKATIDGAKVDVAPFDYSYAAHVSGYEVRTLYGWTYVVKRFPDDPDSPTWRYQPGFCTTGHLTFSHFAICAPNNLPDELVVKWLTLAESNGWSVEDLRREVNEYRLSVAGEIAQTVGDDAPVKKYISAQVAIQTYAEPMAEAILGRAAITPADAAAAAEAAIQWLFDRDDVNDLLKGALHASAGESAAMDGMYANPPVEPTGPIIDGAVAESLDVLDFETPAADWRDPLNVPA